MRSSAGTGPIADAGDAVGSESHKDQRAQLKRRLLISIFALNVAVGCPPVPIPNPTQDAGFWRGMGFKTSRGLGNKCEAGQLTATGWSVEIRKPRVNISTNADKATGKILPSGSSDPATIRGLVVDGYLTAKLRIVICPTPPLCLVKIDGPKLGTTRVDFALNANYEWIFEGKYNVGRTQLSKPVIQKSEIRVVRFDVKNVWGPADKILRKMFKNTINRQLDREVHKRLVKLSTLTDTLNPPDDHEVYRNPYKKGYRPHEGGFCD